MKKILVFFMVFLGYGVCFGYFENRYYCVLSERSVVVEYKKTDNNKKCFEILQNIDKKQKELDQSIANARVLIQKNEDIDYWLMVEKELIKNKDALKKTENRIVDGMRTFEFKLFNKFKKVLDYYIKKEQTKLYFNLGQNKKALPLLKKIIEQDNENHKVIWQIGQVYFEKYDLDTAQFLTQKAIQIKPENPKYYVSMAEILYTKEDLLGAIEYMKQALKLRYTNINYLLSIAILYEELGEIDNAKKYYFKVLELDSTNKESKDKLNSL